MRCLPHRHLLLALMTFILIASALASPEDGAIVVTRWILWVSSR